MRHSDQASQRRVTILLVDGARQDVFEHLVGAGDLPNISRHILAPGGLAPATTSFPSTTGVAYLPFLTGCYPGTCNVPGIRWLDTARYTGRWWHDREHVRSYCGYQGGRLNSDIPESIPTLFDLVSDSVALCTPFTRGLASGRALVALGRQFWGSVAHVTAGYGPLERLVANSLCRLAPERHQLVFAVFPGVDGVTHFHDPWHPAVLEVYREMDGFVGAYAAQGGFEGDNLTLLVSDHGLSRIDRHTDISLKLEEFGLPTLRHPLTWRRNPKVAVMVSGNASAQVYLRPGATRTHRYHVGQIEAGEVEGIPPTLVDYLAQLPGVAMVVGTDPDGLTLVSPRGRAGLSEASDGTIGYRVDTADVLQAGGGSFLEREWLERTIDGAFPDGPVQLLQLYRSPRVGDLTIIADVGADLRLDWEIPEHRSGHGSLIADHMRCLVAANRPIRGPLRTADLFPLILDYLGIPVPDAIDGVALRRSQSADGVEALQQLS